MREQSNNSKPSSPAVLNASPHLIGLSPTKCGISCLYHSGTSPNQKWLELHTSNDLRTTKTFLARIESQTIRSQRPPLIEHLSRGADVAKPSGKLRFLNALCPRRYKRKCLHLTRCPRQGRRPHVRAIHTTANQAMRHATGLGRVAHMRPHR